MSDRRRILLTGSSGFIGTNLMAHLQATGAEVLNVDPSPPLDHDHRRSWVALSVLDRDHLTKVISGFGPSDVVHLAAETSTTGRRSLSDYRVNTEGTANVLAAVAATPSARRVIITSTQFVCRPGYVPKDDLDVDPHTVYGESKVLVENITRAQGAGEAAWTIVRPTTIWGPWDIAYRRAFYRLLRRGLYVHPAVPPCTRSYGYVGNLAWQLERILTLPVDIVAGRVLYVGDRMIDLRTYVDEFVAQCTGKATRTVPLGVARSLARIGDAASALGIPSAPLTSGRLDSMTTDYPVPIESTFELLGEPPFPLDAGVAATLGWLRASVWDGGRRALV